LGYKGRRKAMRAKVVRLFTALAVVVGLAALVLRQHLRPRRRQRLEAAP
jgi:hypothetical protein